MRIPLVLLLVVLGPVLRVAMWLTLAIDGGPHPKNVFGRPVKVLIDSTMAKRAPTSKMTATGFPTAGQANIKRAAPDEAITKIVAPKRAVSNSGVTAISPGSPIESNSAALGSGSSIASPSLPIAPDPALVHRIDSRFVREPTDAWLRHPEVAVNKCGRAVGIGLVSSATFERIAAWVDGARRCGFVLAPVSAVF